MCYTATEISHSDKSDVSFGILHFEKKTFPLALYLSLSLQITLWPLLFFRILLFFRQYADLGNIAQNLMSPLTLALFQEIK